MWVEKDLCSNVYLSLPPLPCCFFFSFNLQFYPCWLPTRHRPVSGHFCVGATGPVITCQSREAVFLEHGSPELPRGSQSPEATQLVTARGLKPVLLPVRSAHSSQRPTVIRSEGQQPDVSPLHLAEAVLDRVFLYIHTFPVALI